MKRTSLAEAKAHLSSLVSEALHRGRRTLILRHGKPSAAIVPVDVARAPVSGRTGTPKTRFTVPQIRALLQRLGRGPRGRSAVAELLAGRR